MNVDSSVKWLQNGANPTETARRILSYKGALMKHQHWQDGVNKGALTQEQADAKFNTWLNEKDNKITSKESNLAQAKADARAKALEAEKEVNEKRKAAAVEAQAAEEVAETVAEETEAPVAEENNETEA